MYKTFRHGGKTGDVIFSLPAIRALGGGIIYIPEETTDGCKNLYSNLAPLLAQQPFIEEVRPYTSGLPYMVQDPFTKIDHDLDLARLQPGKGVVHIVKRYLDSLGIDLPSWKEPWLHIDDYPAPVRGDYILFNYTGRHVVNERMPALHFDWQRLYHSIPGRKVFVGTPEEFAYFNSLTGCEEYLKTGNALELARVVRDAKAIYCNQSFVLALAQALGKTYYLYPKPFKTNCLLYTSNENILQ